MNLADLFLSRNRNINSTNKKTHRTSTDVVKAMGTTFLFDLHFLKLQPREVGGGGGGGGSLATTVVKLTGSLSKGIRTVVNG
jgi:hypothetical protein